MIYIEALDQLPNNLQSKTKLFVAGGITGCCNWQLDFVKLLADTPLVVLNPRRRNFPVDNPLASEEQIIWEFEMLRQSNWVSFWFSSESLCPITLYELGRISTSAKNLFVGCHPSYSRKTDIVIQMKLARPNVEVVFSVDDLAQQVIKETRNIKDE